MGILEQIEKLQKKPVHTREKILALSVIIIMTAIIAIWIQTMDHDFSGAKERSAENSLKTLWGAAREGFKALTDQFQNNADQFQNLNF